MSIEFSKLLKRIRSSSDLEAIAAARNYLNLDRFNVESSSAVDDVEPVANWLYQLMDSYNSVKRSYVALQRYVDQQVDDFIQECSLSIVDYASASAATREYGKQWFISLPFSGEAKQLIATMLIIKVSDYTSEVNAVWRAIQAGDPAVLDAVKYNDGVTEKDAPDLPIALLAQGKKSAEEELDENDDQVEVVKNEQ